MTIPYTFAGATTAIPLANLDANFASPITLGNVAMTLSNTYTSIGNLTLTNVTISSASGIAANTVAYANASGVLTGSANFTFSSTVTSIGITPSTWSLAGYYAAEIGVAGNAIFSGLGDTILSSNTYYNGGWKYAASSVASSLFELNGTNAYLKIANAGTVGGAITWITPMKVDISTYSGYSLLTLDNPTTGSIIDFNINGTRTGSIFTDSTGLNLQTRTAIPVIFSTNATEKMRITSAGYVGIGTTSPNSNLSLGAFNTTGTSNSIRLYDDGAAITSTSNNSYGFGFITNGLSYTAGTSGSHQFYTANTERMRINSSGYVGIGTSSPDNLLTVGTGVRIDGANINSMSNSTGSLGLYGGTNYNSGGGIYINGQGNTNPNIIGFVRQGFVESMRIDSSGNLLVGTTTSYSPLTVHAANGGNAISTGNTSGTGAYNACVFLNNGFSSAVATIYVSGSTVTYNTSSDYRLKNNVAPIQNALSTVEALNPVSFTWLDGRKDDGFLAHELQTVIPNCVIGEKDAVNEDGTPKYQQMDNSGVIPFLVASIKELSAQVTTLQAQVTALTPKA